MLDLMASPCKISVHLGMSIDKSGVWIKTGASMEVDVKKEEITDPNRRQQIFESAYGVLSEQIDLELKRLNVSSDDEG